MATNIDQLDLTQFDPNQLKAISEKAQQMLEKKEKEKVDQAYAQLIEVAKSVDMTLDELLAHGTSKKAKPTRKVAPRYRNPKDASQMWTGRGKQPRWVVEALASGKKITDLEI